MWNLDSGRYLKSLFGHEDSVWALAISSRGKIVSGSGDRTVKIWNVEGALCIKSLRGHKFAVRSLAVAPATGHIISGSDDEQIRVWDLEQDGECVRVLDTAETTAEASAAGAGGLHAGSVRALAVTAAGNILLSAADNRQIRVWDLQSGQCLKTLLAHTLGVMSLAICANTDVSSKKQELAFVSGSRDHTIKVWSLKIDNKAADC